MKLLNSRRVALMGGTLVGALAATAVVRDYRSWYALGEGGVPHNVVGWLMVTLMRIRKREPLGIGPYASMLGVVPDDRWLGGLSRRSGDRPRIAPYPVPHRQLDQPGDEVARALVDKFFADAVADAGKQLFWRRSVFERHTFAITVSPHLISHDTVRQTRGEVAHVHPADGSMHMIFSPSDAVVVLESGWGERHPLAGVGGRLPLTYLLVYSPRSADEADIVSTLLRASIAYMTHQTSLNLA
jgi:hypothetical protein